jgi:hypothetical protein
MNTPTSTWNVSISIGGSKGRGLSKGNGSQITRQKHGNSNKMKFWCS